MQCRIPPLERLGWSPGGSGDGGRARRARLETIASLICDFDGIAVGPELANGTDPEHH